ncbi:MAG: hypothetical protein WBC59_01830 [Phycisphaerae bacterium]
MAWSRRLRTAEPSRCLSIEKSVSTCRSEPDEVARRLQEQKPGPKPKANGQSN